MKIGYWRVSTKDQTPDRQTDALTAEGCEKLFGDKVSGAKSSRPGLDAMLSQLRQGDMVVVVSISRLARSLSHLLELSGEFHRIGVSLKVLDIGIDTSTPYGKLIYVLLGGLAEFERELILERSAKGREAAKARGRNGGRPKGYSNGALQKIKMSQSLWRDRNKNGMSKTQMAQQLGISRTTLNKYLDEKI